MRDVPLLRVPGMMLDERVFAAQIRGLRERRHVLVADVSGTSTVDGMAARALSSAPPVFAIAGLSMGGTVALEVWRRARECVSHLALLDTTPFADTPQRRELPSQQIAAVERGNLREVLIESMKPLCPPEWHEQMAATMPRADLFVLSQCGHLSPLEASDAVTAMLGHLVGRTH